MPRRIGSPPPADGGFSHIHLLLALIVLGIATAMAVPRVDEDAYRLSAAVDGVGGHLLAAQRRAQARGHDVVVAFDVRARALRIHDDTDGDGRIGAGEAVTRVPLGAAAAFGAGGVPRPPWWRGTAAVSFTRTQAGLPAVTFHPDGSASEEGGILLTGRRSATGDGRGRRPRALRVERATGVVAWYEYDGGRWRTAF